MWQPRRAHKLPGQTAVACGHPAAAEGWRARGAKCPPPPKTPHTHAPGAQPPPTSAVSTTVASSCREATDALRCSSFVSALLLLALAPPAPLAPASASAAARAAASWLLMRVRWLSR